MNERDQYPNLPADVSIHHCTAAAPMPKAMGKNAAKMKQLWIHDDAEETQESQEMDGNTMWFVCPNCELHYSVYVGD